MGMGMGSERQSGFWLTPANGCTQRRLRRVGTRCPRGSQFAVSGCLWGSGRVGSKCPPYLNAKRFQAASGTRDAWAASAHPTETALRETTKRHISSGVSNGIPE